jgi:hypothetical protein
MSVEPEQAAQEAIAELLLKTPNRSAACAALVRLR